LVATFALQTFGQMSGGSASNVWKGFAAVGLLVIRA
jgi:hypothetical protein